uniref:Uncharacterized protein n=1 Tax=Timema bartmani TaxID=61472 RepID=A0A7R9F5F4_9NEOP|nr:unnamed protein product [Timema bartmani]
MACRGVLSGPKSPPNSPNTELSTEDDLKGVYINYCYKVKTTKDYVKGPTIIPAKGSARLTSVRASERASDWVAKLASERVISRYLSLLVDEEAPNLG